MVDPPRSRGGAARVLPVLVVVAISGFSAGAAATPSFDVPWLASAARWLPAADAVRVVSLGTPDGRVHRLALRRASARRVGEQRALAELHRFVDDALARGGFGPRVASRVHLAVQRAHRVVGRRALADGSAVLLVEVPGRALRQAGARQGVPW